MSLYALATGVLTADPVRRASANGNAFATATIRAATEDGGVLLSIIAFGAQADQLLARQQGDAVAISGRAKLSSWAGRDGTDHHGLSLVAEQIASAAAARRADADRRRARSAA